MIPLNEYPKEELQSLLKNVMVGRNFCIKYVPHEVDMVYKWIDRIEQAISDQDFKEKELPFKTEDNESREFEL